MAEYILLETMSNELDDLCDRVCAYSKKQRYAMCGACPLGDAFIVLENIQTVDAEPVVHGRWVAVRKSPASITYACSNCEVQSALGVEKYCWNCGAKMGDGE